MKPVLVFPQRGPPPDCPDGYIPYPGNPYVFTRIWVECAVRTQKKSCNSCRNPAMIPWCSFFDCLVTQDICDSCQRPNKTQLPMVNPP